MSLKDVRVVVQDNSDRVWVGTGGDGLFAHFAGKLTAIPIKNAGIDLRTVHDLLVENDSLWVAAESGVWQINLTDLSVQNHNNSGPVEDLIIYDKTLTYMARQEVFKVDPKGHAKVKIPNSLTQNKLKNNQLLELNGQLLLATTGGLFQLDHNCMCFEVFSDDLLGFNIKRLLADDDKLWLGTIENGLIRFDLNDQTITRINQNTDDMNSAPINHVFALFKDAMNVIWVGTFENGLVYFYENVLNFNWKNKFSKGFHCTQSDVVNAFFSQAENLWVGTEKGLVQVNQATKACQLYDENNGLTGNFIKSIKQDTGGFLWVASTQGLDRLDVSENTFENHLNQTMIDGITFISFVGQFELLIGTNSGLFIYNITNKQLSEIASEKKQYSSALYYGVEKFTASEWLLYGNNGLTVMDDAYQLRAYDMSFFDEVDFGLVTALKVLDTDIWLSVDDQKVYRIKDNREINDETALFSSDHTQFTMSAILEDSFGNLWFSGSHGIWYLNPNTSTATQFHEYDGLQSQSFKIGSSHKDQEGQLYFGGSRGFNSFIPETIDLVNQSPDVLLVGLAQMNDRLSIGESTAGGYKLNQSINELGGLQLNHLDLSTSIEFSSTAYVESEGLKMAYRLVNFNNDWTIVSGSDRKATYTNLKPGKYTFEVKAANKDGVWSDPPKSLVISVRPAPWFSLWAYALYALATVIGIFSFIRYRTTAIRKRAVELEAVVNERTQELKTQKQMVESLLNHKNELFANVTHEFKTPLALIKGPAEQLLNDNDLYPHKSKLNMIKRNANRLLVMVGQILKLSEVEQEKAVVRESQDVRPVLNMLYESYHMLAEAKNIDLQVDNQSSAHIYATAEFLEMVIGNLLSNAIKFTSLGGRVLLSSHDHDKQVIITVKDSGGGIADKDQAAVFDRFTRLDTHRNIQGTGIGLAVVKEITMANGGQVHLDSELGKGSTFTITMPIAAWQESESHESTVVQDMVENTSNELIEDNLPTSTRKRNAAVKLLIIEDNLDMRNHVGEVLQDKYQCLFADRGRAGIAIALKEMPDIVLCDVMMPEMDGFQVTRILRNDAKTSHIPIILLTALNTKESRIKGWRENIDVYLTKPFDGKELHATLNAILNVRKILQQKTHASLTVSGTTESLDLPKQDLKFVNKLKSVIADNYHDILFMRPQLAREMNVSERQLQRKVKALIDDSPMNLLRDYRIEMAAKKLSDGFQVSLVVDECGFSSVSYFAACFKKKYGMTPKKYQMAINKKS